MANCVFGFRASLAILVELSIISSPVEISGGARALAKRNDAYQES
jgi:hypothetical protein